MTAICSWCPRPHSSATHHLASSRPIHRSVTISGVGLQYLTIRILIRCARNATQAAGQGSRCRHGLQLTFQSARSIISATTYQLVMPPVRLFLRCSRPADQHVTFEGAFPTLGVPATRGPVGCLSNTVRLKQPHHRPSALDLPLHCLIRFVLTCHIPGQA